MIGAVAGYLSLWTIYWLFKLIRGKEGMGYGDFKLLAALGAWLGWQMLPLIVLLSSVVGAAIGLLLIVFKGRDHSVPLAFGPYLAIAGAIALFFGPDARQDVSPLMYVVVGLTGGIGSGKSEVARHFAALGADVADADAVAHAISARGEAGHRAVVAAFGPDVPSRRRRARPRLAARARVRRRRRSARGSRRCCIR